MKSVSILFCLVISIFAQSLNAQSFEWAAKMGSSSSDQAYSIAVDAMGNTYTTGNFQGKADFDPSSDTFYLTSQGFTDIFVSKFDAAGNFLWAKSMGGITSDYGRSICLDDSGNIYSTGFFTGTADFDPGIDTFNLTVLYATDIYISKLDPSGNFLWAKVIEGSRSDRGLSISVDRSGNVYTTGYFALTADFDPGAGSFSISSYGKDDVFIVKLNTDGNFLWAKNLGGSDYDEGLALTIDNFGNVYSTGFFRGTADFDPGPGIFNLISTNNSPDKFISKLDSAGNFLWAQHIQTTGECYGLSIISDDTGNIYTTGYFNGSSDFDPGIDTFNLNIAGVFDIYISKFDSAGKLVWAKSLGGSGIDVGYSLALDSSGNIYCSGTYKDTADFDPGPEEFKLSSLGGTDIFISKLDPEGNFLWARSIGGAYDDYAQSIVLDPFGNIYTAGYFDGIVDFNPGSGTYDILTTGSHDAFIQKMSPCSISSSTDTITSCNSYTWIDGITYTSSNTTATFKIMNAEGCDSLVKLNLTINYSSSVTDKITACNSYTWIDGITYTSSNNTATHILSNSLGCDSVVNLDLTINRVSDITTSVSGTTIQANSSTASYTWLDCADNYAMISGETNQSFTPKVNGNYAVELSENGCVDTSTCVAINSVGVIDNDFATQLSIYPNPNNGNFTLDMGKNFAIITVKIADIHGEIIESRSFYKSQLINLVLDKPAGIYLLIIESEGNLAVLKVLKN